AEYANMITVACLASLLFLGGWNGPLFGPPLLQAVLPLFWFGLRIFFFLFLYICVRGGLRSWGGEPAGAAPSHQQRTLADRCHGIPRGGIPAAGSRICRGGAGH